MSAIPLRLDRVIAAGAHRYRIERAGASGSTHVWRCERCGTRTSPDARFVDCPAGPVTS